MHFTPWPFWLMIASRATAVLPVLRSPMISSRWPRPTGVMASMALMPVCRGVSTGWRSATPGATNSTSRECGVTIGPLPSLSSCVRRTETISSGLNFCMAALDQLIADDFQLMANAGVIAPVAHLHDHSAEQFGIDFFFEHRLAFGQFTKLANEPAALV